MRCKKCSAHFYCIGLFYSVPPLPYYPIIIPPKNAAQLRKFSSAPTFSASPFSCISLQSPIKGITSLHTLCAQYLPLSSNVFPIPRSLFRLSPHCPCCPLVWEPMFRFPVSSCKNLCKALFLFLHFPLSPILTACFPWSLRFSPLSPSFSALSRKILSIFSFLF